MRVRRSSTVSRLLAAAALLGLGAVACGGGLAGDLSGVHDKKECEVALALPNMVCEEGCPVRVRAALSRVNGVRGVDVDFQTKNAVVDAEYPACSRAGVEDMIGSLFEKGYQARFVRMSSIVRMP